MQGHGGGAVELCLSFHGVVIWFTNLTEEVTHTDGQKPSPPRDGQQHQRQAVTTRDDSCGSWACVVVAMVVVQRGRARADQRQRAEQRGDPGDGHVRLHRPPMLRMS